MKGTKRVFKSALLTMFIFALSMLGVNALKMPNVNAAVIKPYPDNTMGLTVDYDRTDSELDITVTNGDGYQYQYWLKTKVATDNSGDPNKNKSQYIWQMVKGYLESSSSESIPVTADNLDEDERFNVIVRVKNGMVIEELYGAYTLSDLGVPVISFIAVNDKGVYESDVIINKSEPVTLKIFSNIAVDYALYYGDSQTPIGTAANGELGIISLDLSSATYKTGLHTFRAEITKGTVKDIKYFTVYAYEEYKSNEMPVITSLTGNDNGSGTSTFTMKVQFADGITIKDSEKDNFDYTLKSGPYDGTVKSITVNGDTLDVVFEVVYKNYDKNNKGTYETVGKVTRTGANAGDDKIIIYYTGYSQGGSLNLSSISDGSKYTITANGSINNVADSDLQYAFYREDASGWVLIRDYQTISDNPVKYNKLEWTPLKAGTYNIQARIKDKNSVTWEKTASKIFEIGESGLNDSLSVNIYDYETGDAVTSGYEAGKPYKIEAKYTPDGTENLLYMFTLKSKSLGIIYLNNFSPNPCYMFIPNKADTYEITARIINQNSFGFKDKSFNVEIKSKTEFNFIAKNREDVWNVGGTGYCNYYSSPTFEGLMFEAEAGSSISNSTARLDSFVINKAISDGYNAISFNLALSASSDAASAEFRPILISGDSYVPLYDNLGRNFYKTVAKNVYQDVIIKITGNGEYVNGTNQFGVMLSAGVMSKAAIDDVSFVNYDFETETFATTDWALIENFSNWSKYPTSDNLTIGNTGTALFVSPKKYDYKNQSVILNGDVINKAVEQGYTKLSFKVKLANPGTHIKVIPWYGNVSAHTREFYTDNCLTGEGYNAVWAEYSDWTYYEFIIDKETPYNNTTDVFGIQISGQVRVDFMEIKFVKPS